jgi:hypothetical protein
MKTERETRLEGELSQVNLGLDENVNYVLVSVINVNDDHDSARQVVAHILANKSRIAHLDFSFSSQAVNENKRENN